MLATELVYNVRNLHIEVWSLLKEEPPVSSSLSSFWHCHAHAQCLVICDEPSKHVSIIRFKKIFVSIHYHNLLDSVLIFMRWIKFIKPPNSITFAIDTLYRQH